MKPASIAAKITVLLTSAALLCSCSLGDSDDAANSAESNKTQASEDSSKSAFTGMQRAQECRISIELPEG